MNSGGGVRVAVDIGGTFTDIALLNPTAYSTRARFRRRRTIRAVR